MFFPAVPTWTKGNNFTADNQFLVYKQSKMLPTNQTPCPSDCWWFFSASRSLRCSNPVLYPSSSDWCQNLFRETQTHEIVWTLMLFRAWKASSCERVKANILYTNAAKTLESKQTTRERKNYRNWTSALIHVRKKHRNARNCMENHTRQKKIWKNHQIIEQTRYMENMVQNFGNQ